MKHYRVVRDKNKFYVEKRHRFLFWTYWVKLNAYGESNYPWMKFDSSDSVINAMKLCAEDEKETDNDFEIISEIKI